MLPYQLQLLEDVHPCFNFPGFHLASDPHRLVCIAEKGTAIFLHMFAYEFTGGPIKNMSSHPPLGKPPPNGSKHPCNECSSRPLPFCLDNSPLGRKRNCGCSLQTLANYWFQTIESPSIFKIPCPFLTQIEIYQISNIHLSLSEFGNTCPSSAQSSPLSPLDPLDPLA